MMQPEKGGGGGAWPANYNTGFDYGSPANSPRYNNDALERAKQQVEDVKGIMGQNVERIVARGEKLEDLDQRATHLTANASEFQRTSRTLKRKMWWQNLKMMLILGLILVVIIVIIIVVAVGVPNGGHGGGGGTPIHTTPAPQPAITPTHEMGGAI